MDGEQDGAKDPQTSLSPVVSEVTARLSLSAHGTRTEWREIHGRISLEYSILWRIIILNVKERRCQSIAPIYIYIYIYNDTFHMATCFDSQ
jgi:hypothetical protein